MNVPAPEGQTPPASAGAPDQGAADQATGEKSVLVTAKADGSFEVQPMADGQPAGDPVPAASIDEAMQSAQTTLTGDQGAEGSPAEEAGETPGGETTEDAAGLGDASDPAAQEAEAKAQYAKKRGTRPKEMPNWADYANGGNPAAK